MTCTNCGEAVTSPHVFEDTEGKVVARLCRACCPRCDKAPS